MARADRSSPRVSAVVVDRQGRRLPMRALSSWVERAAPSGAFGELSIALVGDSTVRALNRRYRRRDTATDVLSFPSAVPEPLALSPKPFLGDIVIARGVARRQARQEGHSELTELRILALHGLLHLLGYDHEQDHGEMARLEERLRRKAGVSSTGLLRRSVPDALERRGAGKK